MVENWPELMEKERGEERYIKSNWLKKNFIIIGKKKNVFQLVMTIVL